MRLRTVLIALSLPLLAACARTAREADEAYTRGVAAVESVTVEVHHERPARAWATASGTLPDACTELEPADVRRHGSVFEVVLETRRPYGARCSPEPTPFAKRITLRVDTDVMGAYVVTVNGVSQSFAVRPPGPLY